MTTQGFGKVGVLFGGNSAERDVSLRSGNAVVKALQSQSIDVVGIDVNFKKPLLRQLSGIDVAFIALHGRGGEDGVIQTVLNKIGIPYTGSGVIASALAMDKLKTKKNWLESGLPTPEFIMVKEREELRGVLENIGGVAMVKPPHEGSSIGMSKVTNEVGLHQAFSLAREHDDEVMIERWIDGEEYTCAIVNGEALPPIRLETPNDFYDFQAKYESKETEYICPCGLDPDTEHQLQEISLKAFNAIGCKGWGRVDLMLDDDDKFWLLEVNTVPGMTDHSLVPMAAKEAGMSFCQLVIEILKGAELEA